MHLTDIRIDEIVKVDGLPSYARGRATFTNGRTYAFDANFAHGYADARIFVRRPTDRRAMDPTSRTARARNTSSYRVQDMDSHGFRVAVYRPSPYPPMVMDGYLRIVRA